MNIVSAFDIRRKFGEILIGIFQGKEYIVERHGKPVAAVIPIDVFEQWKKNRSNFFGIIKENQKKYSFSPSKANAVVKKAVKEIRK